MYMTLHVGEEPHMPGHTHVPLTTLEGHHQHVDLGTSFHTSGQEAIMIHLLHLMFGRQVVIRLWITKILSLQNQVYGGLRR